MGDLPNISQLHAETQQNRLEFLETELALCFTFADLANTELERMDDREAATRVYAKAEEDYSTISKFLLDVDEGPRKRTAQQGLSELRTTLDSLGHRLRP